MKFVKGVMIGGLITTGIMMMYAEKWYDEQEEIDEKRETIC